MLKGILFDMDGVLINSEKNMKMAWGKVQKEHGIDAGFDEYIKHVGKPFKEILKKIGIEEEIHTCVKKTYGEYAAQNLDKIELYKGVQRVLKELKYSGLKIGIVTSKEFWRADAVVEKFKLAIDLLVTPEQTLRGKPSGEPLIYALKKLGLENKEVVYVGDMKSDEQSAEDAGIEFIYAEWGYGKEYVKGMRVDNIEEVIDVCQSFKNCST